MVQAGLEVLQDPMKGTHGNRRPINDMVVIKREKIMTILFFFYPLCITLLQMTSFSTFSHNALFSLSGAMWHS